MSARERILARLRDARTGATAQAVPMETYLFKHPRGPQPVMMGDLAAYFKGRALNLSSDVMETSDKSTIPSMLAHYLKEKNLPLRGVCWPAFAGLPWSIAGLEIQARPAQDSDLVGVTGAFCAIAETGTLMMLSGPATPATTSLLPETHVAIVDPSRIVATIEDAWELLRKEHSRPPRAVNFVSGPSRTADIEQTVTLGAHGPYRVLLILAPI